MLTLREIKNQTDWKPENVFDNVPLTQTFFYGEIQRNIGREVKRFEIIVNDTSLGFIQFIVYPLVRSMSYWYAPYGPIMRQGIDSKIIDDFKKQISVFLKNQDVVFARFDFMPKLTKENEDMVSLYFKRSPKISYTGAYFQPRNEWYTNLEGTREAMLGIMHSKTRYSVRLAEKKGVITKIISSNFNEHLNSFLDLMRATSERNGFALHDDQYYKSYFDIIEKEGNGFIIEAWHDGSLLASHFIVMVGNTAHYVFGASSNEKRDLCAPYIAHFNAMIEVKNRGLLFYNFGAISLDSDTHWKSLTVFKQKFGGTIFAHSTFFDLVSKPFWYYIYIIRKLIKALI